MIPSPGHIQSSVGQRTRELHQALRAKLQALPTADIPLERCAHIVSIVYLFCSIRGCDDPAMDLQHHLELPGTLRRTNNFNRLFCCLNR